MSNHRQAAVILTVLISLVVPFFIAANIERQLQIETDVSSSAASLDKLEKEVNRIGGIATQFGPFSDFLRFNYIRGQASVEFTTNNAYVNQAIGQNATGSIEPCASSAAFSLTLDALREQINNLQSSLNDDCFKKQTNVNDEFVKSFFKIVKYPEVQVYPDSMSYWYIYLFSFVLLNTPLLILLNILKTLTEILKKDGKNKVV